MTQQQLYRTFETMATFGGGFCSRLAAAWGHADRSNKAKIEQAFPELLEAYGPGSNFYQKKF